MAGEQSFKAVINDTRPSAKGRSFSVEITGSNFNHFLGKKIGDSVEGMFVGDGEQTLNSINLQFKGKEMTSLVGHSGSGKSTIMNLIPRFYDAQSGDITIDNQSSKKPSNYFKEILFEVPVFLKEVWILRV